MKTLLIMRHAKSSWKSVGMDDFDRPLNDRGRRAAPRMGKLLVEQQLQPEIVLCSSAKRAQETAARVMQECEMENPLVLLQELYLAPPDEYVRQLRCQPDEVDRALVIGHNPGLEQLLTVLTGIDEALPTATLAVVGLAIANWRELTLEATGQLIMIWRPRDLD